MVFDEKISDTVSLSRVLDHFIDIWRRKRNHLQWLR